MPRLRGFFYFVPMGFICFNGSFVKDDDQILPVSNGAFRYGESLFETMLAIQGDVPLLTEHFERLAAGLSLLHITPGPLNLELIRQRIWELCQRNGLPGRARIRLMVWRGPGHADYLLEASAISTLPASCEIGLYPEARKVYDAFSRFKTGSYLPFIMARRYAEARGWQESLLLNSEGRVCEGSFTNIFLIKSEKLHTPAITEGCVAGVYRKWLIKKLAAAGIPTNETAFSIQDLQSADELFLTNALRGICSVSRFQDRSYPSLVTERLIGIAATI